MPPPASAPVVKTLRKLPQPAFGHAPPAASPPSHPAAPVPASLDDELNALIAQRDVWKQELRDHERSGTSVEDGPSRMNVFRNKRDKLMEQISRANMKIAAREKKAAANG